MTYYLISEEALSQIELQYVDGATYQDCLKLVRAFLKSSTYVLHDPEENTYDVADNNMPDKLVRQAAEHVRESI